MLCLKFLQLIHFLLINVSLGFLPSLLFFLCSYMCASSDLSGHASSAGTAGDHWLRLWISLWGGIACLLSRFSTFRLIPVSTMPLDALWQILHISSVFCLKTFPFLIILLLLKQTKLLSIKSNMSKKVKIFSCVLSLSHSLSFCIYYFPFFLNLF